MGCIVVIIAIAACAACCFWKWEGTRRPFFYRNYGDRPPQSVLSSWNAY